MNDPAQAKAAPSFLVIDDDPVFSQVLIRALSRRGFNAFHAADGAQALQMVQDHQPLRATLDLKLENESGLQLLPELREHRADLEVVVLTGYSSIATAVQAIKCGAKNYLCKPANTEEILAAFDEAYREKDTAQAPPSVNRLEWEHIQKVLNDHGGNISATARSLGMHRRTLQRKLSKRPVQR